MNGTSGFQELRSSPPDHQRIGSCTSNGINLEKVAGTFPILTISPLSPQASAQSGKRFLTPFSVPSQLAPGLEWLCKAEAPERCKNLIYFLRMIPKPSPRALAVSSME
jgi:hypothetical protein